MRTHVRWLAVLLVMLTSCVPAPSPPPPREVPRLGFVGVEINRRFVARVLPLLEPVDVSWVRYNAILWAEVEPRRGERNWQALAAVEAELALLRAQGITPIVIVRGTPAWAQEQYGVLCGRMRPQFYPDFARFLGELARRYRDTVFYWEIWNEPDVNPALIPPKFPFGCWGQQDDPFYGGAEFGRMLHAVAPAIRQAHPQARIVAGGLALDCDPQAPPRLPDGSRKDCTPGRFLSGMLRGGAAGSFDLAAFHSYTYWDGVPTHDQDLLHPAWAHRGGAVLGRYRFVRATLDAGAVPVPVILNEGGMICTAGADTCFVGEFLDAQAAYVYRFYLRAAAYGMVGAAWYTLNDSAWNESGLAGRGGTARPAYYAWQFLANRLAQTRHVAILSDPTGIGLEGYGFNTAQARYEIYWRNDEQRTTRALPPRTRNVYNIYGHAITPRGRQITIGFTPVVVERRHQLPREDNR